MTEAKHKNVFTALSAAQSAMEPVIKGAVNPAFKGEGKPKGTAYADLSDVVSAVRPALVENGLAFFHQIIRLENGALDMRTSLVHGESDTRIDCDVPLIVAKNDMQGMKSATTYAKRIGLESVTGIAPEDDDGNAAAKAAPKPDTTKDKSISAYDPSPAIAAIEASTTGKELLAAIDAKNCHNENPEIAAARVNRLSILVKGAQSVAVLDAFAKAFAPDWSAVKADADVRRAELSVNNADLGGDELPY